MSAVTNVILSIGTLEDEATRMDEINAWLKNRRCPVCLRHHGGAFGPSLTEQYDAYGGGKVLTATLYVGAFNYFPLDDFRDFLYTIPWEYPGEVQLLVKEPGDDVFSFGMNVLTN